MIINNTPEYDKIWNFVYNELGFAPSSKYRGHSFDVPLPFQIGRSYSVYAVENMTDGQLDLLGDTIRRIFVRLTKAGQRIYALDWQHSSFLYDPRDPSEQQSCVVKDAGYMGGEYFADFPDFYPDGDYCFFIDESLEFGYLGHPWRQEIWIFGSSLIKEIEQVYQKFGWKKIHHP